MKNSKKFLAIIFSYMFKNRKDAGIQLAKKLSKYANHKNTIILALPRGGVPVAYEVAKKLQLPLDVLLVRKIGAPHNPELAIGAISLGGIHMLHEELINYLQIPSEDILQAVAEEKKELLYRNQLYRQNRPQLNLRNQNVIVIDDGIATGASMQVAAMVLRQMRVKKIIIAVPVAANQAVAILEPQAHEIITLSTPLEFDAVGVWYENFQQVTNDEVCRLLKKEYKIMSPVIANSNLQHSNSTWQKVDLG